MGTYVFKLPDIGEGVVEGEITAWHVAVGDTNKPKTCVHASLHTHIIP